MARWAVPGTASQWRIPLPLVRWTASSWNRHRCPEIPVAWAVLGDASPYWERDWGEGKDPTPSGPCWCVLWLRHDQHIVSIDHQTDSHLPWSWDHRPEDILKDSRGRREAEWQRWNSKSCPPPPWPEPQEIAAIHRYCDSEVSVFQVHLGQEVAWPQQVSDRMKPLHLETGVLQVSLLYKLIVRPPQSKERLRRNGQKRPRWLHSSKHFGFFFLHRAQQTLRLASSLGHFKRGSKLYNVLIKKTGSYHTSFNSKSDRQSTWAQYINVCKSNVMKMVRTHYLMSISMWQSSSSTFCEHHFQPLAMGGFSQIYKDQFVDTRRVHFSQKTKSWKAARTPPLDSGFPTSNTASLRQDPRRVGQCATEVTRWCGDGGHPLYSFSLGFL